MLVSRFILRVTFRFFLFQSFLFEFLFGFDFVTNIFKLSFFFLYNPVLTVFFRFSFQFLFSYTHCFLMCACLIFTR